jgi:hypothetical protein
MCTSFFSIERRAEMRGNVGEPAMKLTLFVFRVQVQERTRLGQCAEPIPLQCMRNTKLHNQDAFPNGSFSGDEGDIAQRETILHGPFPRRQPPCAPFGNVAERQGRIRRAPRRIVNARVN